MFEIKLQNNSVIATIADNDNLLHAIDIHLFVSEYGRNWHYGYGDYPKKVLVFELASYSDYGGTIVERANCDYLKEEYDWIDIAIGSYGTRSAFINGTLDADQLAELADVLERLQRYPVLCDQTLSDLEYELAQSAMQDWIVGDTRRALSDSGIEHDLLSDDTIKVLVSEAMIDCNEYWIYETAVSAWLDVTRLVDHIGAAIADEDAIARIESDIVDRALV